jgi:hypothetical protein
VRFSKAPLIGIGRLRARVIGSSSEFDPYRSKAEEMLLCEVIVQYRICPEPLQKGILLMRVLQQDCEKLSARQLPTDCFDIQAFMFRVICDFMSKQVVWLTSITCMKRCTTHL